METAEAALLLSLSLVLAARLPAIPTLRRLAAVWGFLSLLWIALPLSFPGVPVFRTGPFIWTEEGLLKACLISLKSSAIALIFMALIATMNFVRLGRSLQRLGCPSRLVRLMLLSFRYVFVLEDEYRRLRRAMTVRAFRPKTDLDSLRAFAWLAGMLLVRASARSERVCQAMKCRGFAGEFHPLDTCPPRHGDRIWAAGFTAAACGLTAVEIGGIPCLG